MKVLKHGRPEKGWTVERVCIGNGLGGCGALLLVEAGDVYQTASAVGNETTYYHTFMCPECGVESDLQDVPRAVREAARGRTKPNFADPRV
jgi:hypothetical protein